MKIHPRHARGHAVFGDDPSGWCACAECEPLDDCECSPCRRNRVPQYLLDMPKRVLFGSCKGIEKWCRDNEKVRPTLLDLDRARRARKGERR